MKKLTGRTSRLNINMNIFNEVFVENAMPEEINESVQHDQEIEQSSLFKIPRYLETYVFYGMAILINAVIFNLIIIPLKTCVMLFKICFSLKENTWKLKMYLIKIFTIILGVVLKKFLENSFPIFLMHHKLRSLSGMKIFTFIKTIEFLNLLLSKFNKDYDVQLFTIIREPKIKKRILSFLILLFSLFLNIVTFWSYLISLSIILNDPNNFIYPLILKLNYFAMKKSGKIRKKKKILDVVMFAIYDRFFVIFSLFLVIIQNYSDNKINSHNFVDYSYRVFFVVGTELLFDWIRNIIIFKISDLKPNLIKHLTYELLLLHDNLRFNSSHINGATEVGDPQMKEYLRILEDEKFQYFNKKKEMNKYSTFLDFDNILCLQLQNNCTIYCVIVASFIFDKMNLFDFRLLLIVVILLFFRQILQSSFSNYILEYYLNHDKSEVFGENGSQNKDQYFAKDSFSSKSSAQS